MDYMRPGITLLPTTETHPLDETLARLRAMSAWNAVSAVRDDTPGDSMAPSGDWMAASEMAWAGSPYWPQKLAERMAKSGVVDKRLHGYGLWSGYSWLMTTAALACYVLDRRMPALAPQHLRFCEVPQDGETVLALRFAKPRFFCLPSDRAAQHPDATVVADEAGLRAWFHHQIETYFPPAMQILYSLTGYVLPAMWAQVSDNVIFFLIAHVERTGQPEQLEPLIAQFAKVEGSPLKMRNGVLCVTHQAKTQRMAQRAACCQWFRWPEANGARCISCPGYTREKRRELMLSALSAECVGSVQ